MSEEDTVFFSFVFQKGTDEEVVVLEGKRRAGGDENGSGWWDPPAVGEDWRLVSCRFRSLYL